MREASPIASCLGLVKLTSMPCPPPTSLTMSCLILSRMGPSTCFTPNSTSPRLRRTRLQLRHRSALRSSASPLPWSSTASSISSAPVIQKSPMPLSTWSGRPTTMQMATQYFRVCMNITLKFLQPLTCSLTRKSYQSVFARPLSTALTIASQ